MSNTIDSHLQENEKTLNLTNSGLNYAGNKLRGPQIAALSGFSTWFSDEEDMNSDDETSREKSKMGHVILPMGSGKTALAVLFAQEAIEKTGKKVLVLSWSNNTAEGFMSSCKAQNTTNQGQLVPHLAIGGFKANPAANFIVSNFQALNNWPDLSQVGLIIIDEGDVNALSAKRSAGLKAISRDFNIPIVALSATDQLASQKCIEETFPDELLFMGMPHSLKPLLEEGLVPEMDFYDVELNGNLELRGNNQEISDEETEQLLKQNWNKQILDYFDANIRGKNRKTAFIYKNNALLDDLMVQATARGIKIAKLTGRENQNDFERIKTALENGNIDGIAGSKKLGRGLDIPCIDTVFDSQITKSPQLFWQAKGRAFRINSNQADKICALYNFTPKDVSVEGLGAADRHSGPLTHASFFDENYYKRDRKTGSSPVIRGQKHFSLKKLKEIRSGRDVSSERREYKNKPPDFTSLPELIAKRISGIREITAANIFFITGRRRWTAADQEGIEGDSKNDMDWADKMTFDEERQYLAQAITGDKEAIQKLLTANMPAIKALAEVMSEKPEIRDELIQIGLLRLVDTIKSYDMKFRVRLIRNAIKSLFSYMQRYAQRYETSSNVDLSPHYMKKIEALAKLLEKGEIRNRAEIKSHLHIKDKRANKEFCSGDNFLSQFENVVAGTSEELVTENTLSSGMPEYENTLVEHDQIDLLKKIIRYELENKHASVLTRRLGISDPDLNPNGEECTLEKMATERGLTRETIRNVESKGLELLEKKFNQVMASKLSASEIARMNYRMEIQGIQISRKSAVERAIEEDGFIPLMMETIKMNAPALFALLQNEGWDLEAREKVIELIKRLEKIQMDISGIRTYRPRDDSSNIISELNTEKNNLRKSLGFEEGLHYDYNWLLGILNNISYRIEAQIEAQKYLYKTIDS